MLFVEFEIKSDDLFLFNNNIFLKRRKKVHVKVYQLHASKDTLHIYIEKNGGYRKADRSVECGINRHFPNSNPLILENSGIQIPSFGFVAVNCM